MPKKSRRVASRQAQLSGRAKRVRAHGPSGVSTAGPVTPAQGQEPRGDGWSLVEAQPSPESATEGTPPLEAPRTAPTPPPRLRSRAPQVRPVGTYSIPELRRIGLTSVVIVAILVVLVFVLQ